MRNRKVANFPRNVSPKSNTSWSAWPTKSSPWPLPATSSWTFAPAPATSESCSLSCYRSARSTCWKTRKNPSSWPWTAWSGSASPTSCTSSAIWTTLRPALTSEFRCTRAEWPPTLCWKSASSIGRGSSVVPVATGSCTSLIGFGIRGVGSFSGPNCC
uniref:(northern house mosquito) hypothetical protein n=1 Tax=Culex pipiens TaxID=7175 RepID=A0A8D8D0G9_CULPI